MIKITILLVTILSYGLPFAADPWPTRQPLPTLPPAPRFPTPVLPTPHIQPMATPDLPNPAAPSLSTPVLPDPDLGSTPTPGAGGSTYTQTVEMMEDVISSAEDVAEGLSTTIGEFEDTIGLEPGTGDWNPEIVEGYSVYQMVITLTAGMGTAVGYLKGLSYLGSGESQIGVLIMFIVIAFAWVFLISNIKLVIRAALWLVDIVAKVLDAIPFIG